MWTRGRPGMLWVAYLLVGALVVIVYYVLVALGADPLSHVVLYNLVSLSGAVAVFAGCAIHRPRPMLPWLLLGISQLVYAAADISFYVSHYLLEVETYPALADVFYLSHYPLVVAGLVLLIRLRSPGRDLAAVLDATLLAVVAGMLSWLYLIGPRVQSEAPLLPKVVSAAYPMMDLAMLVVALRLILGPGRRPTSFFLLSTNLVAFLTADTIYVLQRLTETYGVGNFLDGIWLSGNLALGAAALHPTMGRVNEPTPVADSGPGPMRIVALCVAALIAPATLLVQYARGSYGDIPAVAGACALLFVLTIARLAVLVGEQRRLAITDVLTGLRTRRFFEAQVPVTLTRARKARAPVVLLLADIDEFKAINDRYGHPAGDQVLIEVAARLRGATRDGDLLARYGGEEFALLVTADEPAVIAERLRERVANSPITISGGITLPVTVSVGTASYPRHGQTPEELITAADRALYTAKTQGRNRIVTGPADEDTPAAIAAEPGTLAYLQQVAEQVDGWLSNPAHSPTVGRWAALVAAELGEPSATVRRAELAGRLHDVGKIAVPKDIWTKPATLTPAEWQQVRSHPEHGYRLVRVLSGLDDVATVIHQQHERMDGTGYPFGLPGPEIRIEARIVAVCNAWAAMRTRRPYHPARTEHEAREELLHGSGGQFDPSVVDAFLRLHDAGRLHPSGHPPADTLRYHESPDATVRAASVAVHPS